MQHYALRNLIVILVVLIVGSALLVRFHAPTEIVTQTPSVPKETARAYFAGGCFWSMGSAFSHVPGVIDVVTGYMGGHLENPTYHDINTETTGHRETVMVLYDPTQVSYGALVAYYFSHVDPTDRSGAFVDRGESYTSAIFYQNESEHAVVNKEIEHIMGAYPGMIVTHVAQAGTFWRAEEYHQHYPEKNPTQYALYRAGSGRDARINELCAYREARGVPCVSIDNMMSMTNANLPAGSTIMPITHATLSEESDPNTQTGNATATEELMPL